MGPLSGAGLLAACAKIVCPAGAREYPLVVDRICPFLALSADHRTVVDGYDPGHACHALPEPEALDRSRQAEQCLTEAHRQCDRYLAFLRRRASDIATFPAPSADALITRTRLVLEPEARRRRGMGTAPLGLRPRRWLMAGGVAAVGVAAAATAAGGGFSGLVGRTPPSDPEPRPSTTSSPAPRVSPAQTAEATVEASHAASPQPATPASTPQATTRSAVATAEPSPATYVVRQGDTLSLVATRFGTSVAAIQRANGLNSDVINIGQVLVIP
jgi:LysM repeat protein